MKLISWNVNGIRAVAKKGLTDILTELNADIYCFQETKATPEQVREVLFEMTDYVVYANGAEKKGYSGTAVMVKKSPKKVFNDIGIDIHDKEGRVVNVDMGDFYLVNTYVPNAKAGLIRLDYRQQWDADMLKHLQKLEEEKPVVFTGDLNVCHRAIDIARPQPNYNKSPGFTQVEIDGMDNYHEAGFIDSFRILHPEKVQYSWWSFRGNARANNVGWRIDYFLISETIKNKVKAAYILDEIHGSDHCPVGLELNL